jgi:2-polyprenyl-3-methyl-5-hydroxy-6-metoxy-1,4-benzoquinol methylase
MSFNLIKQINQKKGFFYNFLEHPFFYDFIQHATLAYKFRNRLIMEELKKNKFNKILDIGCGTANILNVLGNNMKYYGFDTNKKCIIYAKNKYINQNFFCKIFDKKNSKIVPKVDVIILNAVLHHLNSKEIILLLELLKNKIKNDGKIIIIEPFYSKTTFSFRNILVKIRDKIGEYDRGNFVRSINEYRKLISKKLKIKKVQVEYPILPPLNFVKFICN